MDDFLEEIKQFVPKAEGTDKTEQSESTEPNVGLITSEDLNEEVKQAEEKTEDAGEENSVDENLQEPKGNTEESEPNTTDEQPKVEGKEVETKETTSKKVFANKELEELNAFIEKTGLTINDYNDLKKPTSQIDDEEILKQYLSKGKEMSDVEIAYELKRLEKPKDEFGDDLEDEDDLESLRLKAEKSRLVREARAWRNNYVKEVFRFEKETKETKSEDVKKDLSPKAIVESYLKEQESLHGRRVDEFRADFYKALPTINQIELDVQGEKVNFTPDAEFLKSLRQTGENLDTLVEKHFDQNGKVKDAKAYALDIPLWLNPNTRNAMIQFIVEQAIIKDRTLEDRTRRNIDTSEPKGNVGGVDSSVVLDDFLSKYNESHF